MPGAPRIVIAAPVRAECETVAAWVRSDGFEPVPIPNLKAALDDVRQHPFDLLVADHGFAFHGGLHAASRTRIRNPQTPTIVIRNAAGPAAQASADHQQAMFLERPVEQASVSCLVSMAIMEARPQRRSPRKPVARFEALVDSVPCYLIDASNEGLRLEISRDRLVVPRPCFSVRVPMIGVTLMVRRIWTQLASVVTGPAVAWCGGALAQNPAKVEQRWRTFVDALPGGDRPAPEPTRG